MFQMHRLLLRCGKKYLNATQFVSSTSMATRKIHTSFGCQKQIQLTDEDLSDLPVFCENTKRLTKTHFKYYMEQVLHCSSDVVTAIWSTHPELSEKTLNQIKKNVDLLSLKGVTDTVILENPSLLVLSNASLCSRLRVIEGMKPDVIADFAPLVIIPEWRLTELKGIAEQEQDIVPSRHRIYHFSKLLGMKPNIFSKYVSKRLHLLELPFKDVDNRIKLFLKYKTPDEIVKNLWPIRRSTETLSSRLAQAEKSGLPLYKIYSTEKEWYLSNKKRYERNELLGGRSIAQFYADSLNCDIRNVEEMLKLYPQLERSNLMTIHKKIDYLLNEADIPGSDVVRFPCVLIMAFDKMKERIQELQLYNCRQINRLLGNVYQSQREYNKFCRRLKEKQEENAAVNQEE